MSGSKIRKNGEVLKRQVLVEILEGDPFEGCCAPAVASESAVAELRNLLAKREAIIKSLDHRFGDRIRIERTILSRRRRADSYPQHVRPHLGKDVKPPLILVDQRLVWHGDFPSQGAFEQIIEGALADARA